MLIPGVSISLAKGQIGGAPTTNDGVVGLIGTGAGSVPYLTPKLVFSLADAVEQGFTEVAEPILYRHIKEFYSVAPLNAKLYVMTAVNTASIMSLVDKDNAEGAAKLLAFAGGEIRALGVVRTPAGGYVPTTPAFIDSDCTAALVNGKTLVKEYFGKIMPFRLLIGARVHDNTSNTVFNPSAQDNNAVALVLGGTLNDGSASMGLVLGKVAATPPHRNIGRVKDGALPALNMYIGDKKVREYAGLGSLIQNGFLTFQAYPQKDGFFVSDDPMSTDATDDYRYLVNCRVIDKAAIIAYQTYLEELKDEVDLDGQGQLSAIDLKHLEAVITGNIMLGMGDSISGEPVTFIPPGQNLATDSRLKIQLRLIPKGYLRLIEVEIGFINPANQ